MSAASGVRLVIVESPAKAKTIQRYLGPGYRVEASVGHIRDLPSRKAQVPAKFRDEPWSELGVNVADDFAPLYIVSPDKRAKVAELKAELANASELLLATDEDREGEAIAWHLLEVLKPSVPYSRMVFNEITPEAIKAAAAHPRELDYNLIDAQETRRVIDRLYGYKVSPVLWRKVQPQLSAGRVQSVALRLIVQRERERIAFTSAQYWDLHALMTPGDFKAAVNTIAGVRVASGKDFNDEGQLTNSSVIRLDESAATELAEALAAVPAQVTNVVEKPFSQRPAAPFTTSTLQQEAGRKLRWGAQRSMRVAQGLYERGYITYMRTDSTSLSQTAINAARSQAKELYGESFVASAPRVYKSKAKNAQEAHEAIRPAGDNFRTPAQVAGELSGDDFMLYELIWRRTLASQMADARKSTTTIKMSATSNDGREVGLSSSGTVVLFPGFLAAYEEGSDDEGDQKQGPRLPVLAVGDQLTLTQVDAAGHQTKPPARYTEASLVKQMEEQGIGRPSTYASIITTIQDRGYVFKRGSALVPTWLGFSVVRLLENHFGPLVDYEFTARMEENLDQIAKGDQRRADTLRQFYSGDQSQQNFPGLDPLVSNFPDIDARANATFALPGCDVPVRVGRFGPYLEAGERRVNVPAELAPDELTSDKVTELLTTSGDRELGIDPASGRMIMAKSGRFGPYVTEVPFAEEAELTGRKKFKPRTASLFKSMTLAEIDLDTALRLLTLPREIGTHPESGHPITAHNGRYGPYITCDGDSRSLTEEAQLFTLTLPEALQVLSQPKVRRGRQADPGTPIGSDPNSGQEIVLKNGRFGPYVTDGETNASLRVGDDPLSLTLQRAAELLADRRAAGPPKKRAKKAATKKTATKKTTVKKAAAKKTTAKKAVAKKSPAKKAAVKKAAVKKAMVPSEPVHQ